MHAVGAPLELLPAHAGVIRNGLQDNRGYCTSPRTRGGDPYYGEYESPYVHFSPHTRG